jgi:AraC-like DNA-binding protein
MVSPPCKVEGHGSSTYLHRLALVNRTARYIEENLGEPIHLDDMARAAASSKFHLLRVFEECAGSTLGRYLGGVRLKVALHLLSEPETRRLSVLEVALRVGFEDASAFSRGFHRRYGVTPSTLRQGHRPRPFPHFSPSIDSAALDHGVTLVSLPAFWIYGYEVGGQEHKSFSREAPQGFKLMWDAILRHGIEGVRGEVGLPTYSWVLRDETCRFLCGFRSRVRLDVGSMQERSLGAGDWLRARHAGPYDTRWQTWQRLKLQQLRLGTPDDGREPFEEEVEYESRRLGYPCCDVYFPC